MGKNVKKMQRMFLIFFRTCDGNQLGAFQLNHTPCPGDKCWRYCNQLDRNHRTRKKFEISINSHGTSWQQTAKIVQNADNGGNKHDSSKIAQETPPEIQRRIFWCNKIFPKNIFSAEILPEMNRKLTGNDIFQTMKRYVWALELHSSCQI